METRAKRGSRGSEPGELPVETATALGEAVELPEPAVEPPAEPQPVVPPVDLAPPPAAETIRHSYDPAPSGQQAFSALAESRAAMARGLDAISSEIAGLARSEIAAAAGAASDLLDARTLADAVAANALFARRSLATLFAGSAKISELAVRTAAESAEPLTTRLGTNWIRAVWVGV